MIWICLPLARYMENTPCPPADLPRLKYRAFSENCAESGNNRTENGSSNDSSTSRVFNEQSGWSGWLSQSNSILLFLVYQLTIFSPYNVFTPYLRKCNRLRRFFWNFFCRMGYCPNLSIILMSGRNIAITMLPTMTAKNTIIIGSNNDVMAVTALSTSSS